MNSNKTVDRAEKHRPVNCRAIMREKMKNKDKHDYKVGFSGTTISKKEANKVGVALLFGFVGVIAIGLTFGITNNKRYA